MTDPRQAAGGDQQPSEEELRAQLEQLRGMQPGEFVAQAFNVLATGAQAKLGEADARLLIDAIGGLVQAIGDQMPDELATPMRNGLSQLQTAQVQAERGEQTGEPESGADPAAGGQPSTGDPGNPQAGQGEGGQRMTDRLWVPGRDPR